LFQNNTDACFSLFLNTNFEVRNTELPWGKWTLVWKGVKSWFYIIFIYSTCNLLLLFY